MTYRIVSMAILVICLGVVGCLENGVPIYEQGQMEVVQYQPFVIVEPSAMKRVVAKEILQQSINLRCKTVSPNITAKHQAEYFIFREDNITSIETQWTPQIVASSIIPQTRLILILLSNGTILKLEQIFFPEQTLQLRNTYHPIQSYYWFQGQIIPLTQHQIFIQNQGSMYYLTLSDNVWSLGNELIRQTVTNFKTFNSKLYLLTPSILTIIDEFNSIQVIYPPKNLYFVDFDVVTGYIFLLTVKGLVIADVYSLRTVRSVLIDEGQWARRIRATNQHMLIEYTKKGQTIIREFYFETHNISPQNILNQRLLFESNQEIRPGKIHRQFHRIQDIVLTERYAISVEKFQFSIFQVNVNAETPLTLFDNRFILKADRAVQLQLVNNITLTFMIAEAGKVSIVQLSGEILSNDLFRGGLMCTTQQQGRQQLQVQYLGVCGQQYHWQCSKIVRYQITSQYFDPFFTTIDWIIIILLLLLNLGFVIFYRKIKSNLSARGSSTHQHRNQRSNQYNTGSVEDSQTHSVLKS